MWQMTMSRKRIRKWMVAPSDGEITCAVQMNRRKKKWLERWRWPKCSEKAVVMESLVELGN